MDGQLVAVCCPEDSSSELILLVTRWRQELAELRRRGPGLAPREPRTAPAGRLLEESPSRCPGPRHRPGTESRTTRRRKAATPSRSLRTTLRDPVCATIAPTTSTTLKTMPSDPGGIAANNRRTPDPSAAIIPDCRPARNSANCLRSAVSAPAAASRCSRAVIPKTPSRSRSRCGPTAGSFGGGDTSGPAPATVRSPSPPRRLPS